ncbi:MAG: carbohydrate ABC transporter permease [Sphaerochaeta sp.]|uniref:carbohydrate ABC transporter permease n=1 Tax=Sphaerochaeta sp. TaxID=1972642 RepID=UPI003D097BB8
MNRIISKTKFNFRLTKENQAGILFTMPFLIGFLAFSLIPMGMSFYYSFSKYDILSPPRWVGLKNYVDMVSDKTMWQSLGVTLFYSFVSGPLRMATALVVAMLLFRNGKVVAIFRAVYYLPSIIGGSVAIAVLWKRMFASDGVINGILNTLGVSVTYSWIGGENTAIWTLIILSVWQFGSAMLIFLAGLKQIPISLYEAAMVDGVGRWKRFTRITLPMLSPTIFFNLIMQVITGFMAFTQSFLITEGKPLNRTLFYMVYVYNQSFKYYNMGYGAALSWFMILIVGTITILLFKTQKYWVYEE